MVKLKKKLQKGLVKGLAGAGGIGFAGGVYGASLFGQSYPVLIPIGAGVTLLGVAGMGASSLLESKLRRKLRKAV